MTVRVGIDGFDGTCVKIRARYDKEWGYLNRMVELARKVGQSLP